MVHLVSNSAGVNLLEMEVVGSELAYIDLVVVDWNRTGIGLGPTNLCTAVVGTAPGPTIGFLDSILIDKCSNVRVVDSKWMDCDGPSHLRWNDNWMHTVFAWCPHVLLRCLLLYLHLND